MARFWWQRFRSWLLDVDRGDRRRRLRAPRGPSLELQVLEERIELSTPSFGTLKNTPEFVQWAGALARTDPSVGDRFLLHVDLPGGVWNNKPGGVQISVRWTPAFAAEDDNLFLYVYRDNTLVAKSDGIISTAQSVRIPMALNGDYTVAVVYDPASETNRISYQAYADVEYTPNVQPVRALLPDLAVRPQRNVTFTTPPPIFFDLPPAPGSSCFPSEIQERGARNCLRFDQVIANVGEGPMELRFALPHDPTSTAHNVFQRVHRSDGSFTDRFAGNFAFHPFHNHYHYLNFALSRLWKSDQAGEQLDTQPIRSGRKQGFCLADVEIDGWLQKGTGARRYNAPDCLFPDPTQTDANFDYLVQGITKGWADVYEWYLPGQYIEVTGLLDGYYLLETIANPDNLLLESSYANNSGSVLIRLRNMGTPAQTADLLGPVGNAPPPGRRPPPGSDPRADQLALGQPLASLEAATEALFASQSQKVGRVVLPLTPASAENDRSIAAAPVLNGASGFPLTPIERRVDSSTDRLEPKTTFTLQRGGDDGGDVMDMNIIAEPPMLSPRARRNGPDR